MNNRKIIRPKIVKAKQFTFVFSSREGQLLPVQKQVNHINCHGNLGCCEQCYIISGILTLTGQNSKFAVIELCSETNNKQWV